MSLKAKLYRQYSALARQPSLLRDLHEAVDQALAQEAWDRLNGPPRILVALEHHDHTEVREIELPELVYHGPLPDPPWWASREFADVPLLVDVARVIE